jgi:peptidyl-dipeptidase A
MTYFERQLYADPDSDLDGKWWELVERYQMLRRPDRPAPEAWAAKYHIALAPVYYQNYQMGHLMRAQFEAHIREEFGGLAGREAAGKWLRCEVFEPGAQLDWRAHIEHATGVPLTIDPFLTTLG